MESYEAIAEAVHEKCKTLQKTWRIERALLSKSPYQVSGRTFARVLVLEMEPQTEEGMGKLLRQLGLTREEAIVLLKFDGQYHCTFHERFMPDLTLFAHRRAKLLWEHPRARKRKKARAS